jgi:hypothetical protein
MTMRQDAVILYCVRCDTGYASIGEVPPQCPACHHATRWTTTPPHGDIPRVPYKLTPNDRAFMKRRGIDSEREPS